MSETKRAGKPVKATKANITRVLKAAGFEPNRKVSGGFEITANEFSNGDVWLCIDHVTFNRGHFLDCEAAQELAEYVRVLLGRFDVLKQKYDGELVWVVSEKQGGKENK